MVNCQRSELSIQLESDEIFLRGTVNESAGATLRGAVILHLTELTKIKSIGLTFQGRNNVYWSEGVGSAQRYYIEERKIIEHTLDVLKPRGKPYIFTAGTFKWDFELPVPGDLPGTLHHELGEASYLLKAVAERPVFSFNYTSKRDITVTRLMLPSSLEHNQSVVVSNEWPNKIAYNISLPRLIFSPGSRVPVAFDMTPLTDGLSIQSIACSFEEWITLSCRNHSLSKTDLTVRVIPSSKLSCAENQFHITKVFVIPEHPIRADVQSDLIAISHRIRVTIALSNPDGRTSELRASIPLVIASVVPEEEAKELPAYQDALKSLPYNPIVLGMTTNSTHGTLPSVACDDLSGLPSYTTAIQSDRFFDCSDPSLPTYDSILISTAH